MLSAAVALAAAGAASTALAATVKAYGWDLDPPTDTRDNFIAWGKARGEDPGFLGQRWDRFQAILANKDIWDARTSRAFLLTPREEFASVNPAIHPRAYEHAFLDIGYGVTMSGPHLQSRMTNVIDVKRGEKVLEVGTGSGVQSAYIANLTENAYTIEIIQPLAARTRALYDRLIDKGSSISRPGPPTATTAGKRLPRSTRSSSPAASITCRRRSCSSSSRAA